MNYDCTTHPICPSLQLLQSFFQNIALNGCWHRDEWLLPFQFYRKTFLRSIEMLWNPKQPNNVKFSLWSIIETSQREGAWLLRGGTKIRRGDAKRSQGQVRTSPHLRSKSGHALNSEYRWVYKSLSCSRWWLTEWKNNEKFTIFIVFLFTTVIV